MNYKIYLNYYLSVIIWQFFNPVGFYQSFLQNFGQAFSIIRSLFMKESISYRPMSLPFNEKWKVFNGGTDKSNSHSWNIISQRYAYDFVLPEDVGKGFSSEKNDVNNYSTFNKNVFSPNDGVVEEVKNNVNDNKHAGLGWIDVRTRDIRGNFIIIKHDENVYSLTAHLKKKSCLVKKGDAVKRGQIIANCGNSGHSTQPHIHFQLQDRPNWYFSKGLPIIFADVLKNSTDNNENVFISRNDLVSNTNSNKTIFNKIKIDPFLSKDLTSALVMSIINSFGILIGGGFIYFTIIKLIIRIVTLAI
jgi:Peptidase family M23